MADGGGEVLLPAEDLPAGPRECHIAIPPRERAHPRGEAGRPGPRLPGGGDQGAWGQGAEAAGRRVPHRRAHQGLGLPHRRCSEPDPQPRWMPPSGECRARQPRSSSREQEEREPRAPLSGAKRRRGPQSGHGSEGEFHQSRQGRGTGVAHAGMASGCPQAGRQAVVHGDASSDVQSARGMHAHDVVRRRIRGKTKCNPLDAARRGEQLREGHVAGADRRDGGEDVPGGDQSSDYNRFPPQHAGRACALGDGRLESLDAGATSGAAHARVRSQPLRIVYGEMNTQKSTSLPVSAAASAGAASSGQSCSAATASPTSSIVG